MNLFFNCELYVFNCMLSSTRMCDLESLCSIEYWFRCMDVDGDGFLSMYELEYFYQEQLQRLEALGIETLPFTDCLCQVGLLKILIFAKFCLFFFRNMRQPLQHNLYIYHIFWLLSRVKRTQRKLNSCWKIILSHFC